LTDRFYLTSGKLARKRRFPKRLFEGNLELSNTSEPKDLTVGNRLELYVTILNLVGQNMRMNDLRNVVTVEFCF